jgi:hypothetical protein
MISITPRAKGNCFQNDVKAAVGRLSDDMWTGLEAIQDIPERYIFCE